MKHLSDGALNHLREVLETPDLSNTKYKCIRKIAAGGMGTVFLAEDIHLKRSVALKVLNVPDAGEDLVERMMREARVLAHLEHPGIVPVHDAGILPDGRVFYVMKFVKGDRLDHVAEKQIPLPGLLRLFQKVCEAVAFAHAHDVIHRDLKPENIMVSEFGEVLVMDWGLAKFLSIQDPDREMVPQAGNVEIHPTDTQAGTVLATRAYMAPEQAAGAIDQIDKRSDVYSLGAILSFLVASVPQKAPQLLKAIYSKAMAQQKEGRYNSAAELSQDVDRFLNGLSVSSYQENTFEKIGRWVDHNKFVVSLVLVYIIVRFLIYFLTRR